jgi:hypothetical protein
LIWFQNFKDALLWVVGNGYEAVVCLLEEDAALGGLERARGGSVVATGAQGGCRREE